jgi:hypothetical protein
MVFIAIEFEWDAIVTRRERVIVMPPMFWHIRRGDILDEMAEVLVCSANPFLTLSGGVAGRCCSDTAQ